MTHYQERDFCDSVAALIQRLGFVPLDGSPVAVWQAMTDNGMFHAYLPQPSYGDRTLVGIYGQFTDPYVFKKMVVCETGDLVDIRDGSTWHVTSRYGDKLLRAFQNYMAEVNARPPTSEEMAADTWKPEKTESFVVEKLKTAGWWIVGFVGLIIFYEVAIVVFKILGALVSSPSKP